MSDYEVIIIPDSDDDVASHSDDDLPPFPTRRVCMWNPATSEDTAPVIIFLTCNTYVHDSMYLTFDRTTQALGIL